MKNFITIILLSITSSAFAGGDGAASLIPSAVNVLILAGGLIYLLKDKASVFFSDKSSVVSEMIDRASAKAKEAEEMMAIQKQKISSVDAEIASLKSEQEKSISEYEAAYSAEVKERISKLKEDTDIKIEAEKTEMLNELNANLLDLVINNAKTKISADPSLSKSVTDNLIKGL